MFRLFHLQIIPSEERFTASQSTLPYSYKAFHFETLQTFAQNWAFISGTSEDQKRYSPCWLYAATDISFFFFFLAPVEGKPTVHLFLLAQMRLLSVIETCTKTQWHLPKQTVPILKCFSSLKQIDFFLLYHLPILKAGKGQHIGSCCLPMFGTDTL